MSVVGRTLTASACVPPRPACSLVNYDITLRDPVKGSDPQEATFLAAWAFWSYLLMPLWLLVFGVRTWLWLLSCGIAFSQPPLPVVKLDD